MKNNIKRRDGIITLTCDEGFEGISGEQQTLLCGFCVR